MKKLFFSLLPLLLGGTLLAQPVSDNAVIPVAVTLNSILRLNIVSGGNVEFSVNTLDQFTNGISNSSAYDTKFTVASSIDFDVVLMAEDANLIGSDDATGTSTVTLDNIGYTMSEDGTGTPATNWTMSTALAALTALEVEIIQSIVNNGAGDVAQNSFTVNWEMGTGGAPMNTNSLLQQSIAADRYATNVYLFVQAAD